MSDTKVLKLVRKTKAETPARDGKEEEKQVEAARPAVQLSVAQPATAPTAVAPPAVAPKPRAAAKTARSSEQAP